MARDNKHPYGAGSVYQTKEGEWRGRVVLEDPVTHIKQKPKMFYGGKTEAEIWRRIKEYRDDPLNYSGRSVGKVNTARYFRKWVDEYKKEELKVSSYDRLDSVVRLYIEPKLDVYQLEEVTPDVCQKLIVEMKDRGLSYSTTKKAYDAMNDCFRFAVDRQEIPFSPMQTVKMPAKEKFKTKRKDAQEARALKVEEETAFFAELDRKTASTDRYVYRYRDAFTLDINTGLRIGELVALDWTDVNFEARTMNIWKTAVMVKERDENGDPIGKVSQIIQETPKTNKSNRTVPLNKKAFSALKRLKAQAGNSPYVFPTQTGARLVMASLEKQYANVAAHCAIEGTSFHSLRHTFATRLFEKGADVKKVSALLGHSSVQVTYNTYIDVIQESKAEVVQLLDDDETDSLEYAE